MQLAIIGLPGVGKTTIFNALTGEQIPTAAWSAAGRIDVHTAIVSIPDPRVDALSQRFEPKKTTYAKVTYADIGGLQAEVIRQGLPGQLLNQLEQMDGFLHVLRAFEDPQQEAAVNPQADLQAMEAEFLLRDMLVAERRLEKLSEERQKGGRERATVEREMTFFQRIAKALGEEEPLRSLALEGEERSLLAGFGFLTHKPVLVVLNVAEGQEAPPLEALGKGMQAIAMQGKLEMELAQLSPEDEQAFLEEFGLEEAGRNRVLRASADLLGLITFFTINEQELRAWSVPAGSTALMAAGTIHTDLARGFIRAEILGWEELLALGGLAEARAAGKLRLEGKDHVIADGDVIYIRFNI
jgi:GTP-binding protein YchF